MPRKSMLVLWPLIGLMALLIAACGGGASTPNATAAPVPSTTTPAPILTPTPNPSPTPVLTPSQVFSLVSPSVAFIETPIASESEILIDGGYFLTNSHVVHGFNKAGVGFQTVHNS